MTPAARPRRWPGVAAWALWVLAMLGLPVVAWLDYLLHQAGYPVRWVEAANVPALVASVSAATVGAVLASRRPAHPVGWLLLGLGLLVPVAGIAWGYVRYGVVARPGSLPAASYVAGIANGPIVFLWLACVSFVLLLTPTGSLPSPGWRWWAGAAATAVVLGLVAGAMDPYPLYPEDPTIANPLFVPALRGPLLAVQTASMVILLAAPVVAAASLVGRFRRARGMERQQLRWLAFAAAAAAVALLVAVAAALVVGNDHVVAVAAGTGVALLPLATGAAILRYRLYDIDRIISRTVAYGLLTVLLGGAYATVVLALGQLLGHDSGLVVAVATLAVAALFQPARRRVQRSVDRRFNRRRYDAAQTIGAFGARLRQQVDLDTLTAELLGVVKQTMQPTQVSLWLRPVPRPGALAAGTAAQRRI